ncbi:T9SS type A sorting domain-containing protein [Longitalea luteola]|uniref:T9SS type A sorting domain-containing protein n=1 Tax=Longitalea luteola TaxID=2812563 RepID=UPI001A97A815|nr:T9SS type A sorting domain-containing protein [Longitalea luteola]
MCKIVRYVLMLAVFPVAAIGQSDQNTYAITAVIKGSNDWVALRTLNNKTGKFGEMLLNMNDRGLPHRDIATHKLKDNIAWPVLPVPVVANNPAAPKVNTGVAAIAFDERTNRLFYVSMSDDILRYIDLSTMQVHAEPALSFSKAGNYTFRSSNPVTRLVITPDGYGYTVTTDGSRLIRFTTNNQPSFTDMGELKDDPRNKEMSILNTCSNLGGDMVADDAGNLYLITASNRVYKIDIKTLLTTYLATITNLPATFTTNGAAITEDGKLLVSSSVYTEASFIVDHKSWQASPAPAVQHLYGIADLASSNVIATKKSNPSVMLIGRTLLKTGNVKVYPNPVLFDEVNIQFNDLPAGKYFIELADPLGRKVIKQKVQLTRQGQTALIQIPTSTAQAFYYIRILNEKNALVSTHKLAVERWRW